MARARSPQRLRRRRAPAPLKPGVGFNLLAASAVSGGLLWACFQPLGLGAYLGWFALVPFLTLVRTQARPRFIYFCAWLTGITLFIPALQWMRVADDLMFLAWFALAVYCALFFPAALFCVRRLERWNVPLIVSAPAVWVAFEYVPLLGADRVPLVSARPHAARRFADDPDRRPGGRLPGERRGRRRQRVSLRCRLAIPRGAAMVRSAGDRPLPPLLRAGTCSIAAPWATACFAAI